MPRTYAKSLTAIWDPGNDFRDLTEGAQRLYWLMYSHPQLSAAGVLPLQPRQWARFASDTTPKKIERYLASLVETRKVLVDDDTDEALVRAFIRTDGGTTSPNGRTAITRAIDSIESKTLRQAAKDELTRALGAPRSAPREGAMPGATEGNGEAPGSLLTSPKPPPNHLTSPEESSLQISSTSTVVREPVSVEDDQRSPIEEWAERMRIT